MGLRTGDQPKCSGPDRGRGLWTEGLCSQGGRVDDANPGLSLLLTHQSRCFGVTSSSVVLTLLLHVGGRDCKTSGQSQSEAGGPHDHLFFPNLSPSQRLPILHISRFQKLLRGLSSITYLSLLRVPAMGAVTALARPPCLSLPSLTSELL